MVCRCPSSPSSHPPGLDQRLRLSSMSRLETDCNESAHGPSSFTSLPTLLPHDWIVVLDPPNGTPHAKSHARAMAASGGCKGGFMSVAAERAAPTYGEGRLVAVAQQEEGRASSMTPAAHFRQPNAAATAVVGGGDARRQTYASSQPIAPASAAAWRLLRASRPSTSRLPTGRKRAMAEVVRACRRRRCTHQTRVKLTTTRWAPVALAPLDLQLGHLLALSTRAHARWQRRVARRLSQCPVPHHCSAASSVRLSTRAKRPPPRAAPAAAVCQYVLVRVTCHGPSLASFRRHSRA